VLALALGVAACRSSGVDLDVRGGAQTHRLSCEACAAAALASAHGLVVAEDAVQAGFPASDNPDLGFVGDVDGPPGGLPPEAYGVHAEPVAARLRDLGLPARAERGRDAAWLRARLAEGRPVVVWATADMTPRAPVVRTDRSGRTFRAVAWEHALLAIGYDRSSVRLLDPCDGRRREVPWATFQRAWASLDGMAVWVPTAFTQIDTTRLP
jgi:uncharacterized protein YvpB